MAKGRRLGLQRFKDLELAAIALEYIQEIREKDATEVTCNQRAFFAALARFSSTRKLTGRSEDDDFFKEFDQLVLEFEKRLGFDIFHVHRILEEVGLAAERTSYEEVLKSGSFHKPVPSVMIAGPYARDLSGIFIAHRKETAPAVQTA